MSDSCLIIGGNGFVGSGIQASARAHGWNVFVADRNSYDGFRGRKFDVVINANGNSKRYYADKDPMFDFEASVTSVYRSLLDFPDSHYALVSTVDVYNDPTRPESTTEDTPVDPHTLGAYAFHKWMAEQLVMRQERPWHIFRLAQMVGPGLRKGPMFDLLNQQPLWIDGRTRLHFMDTQNVGSAMCRLIRDAPHDNIFNVCGRGSVEFSHVLNLFGDQDIEYCESPGVQCYDVNTEKTEQWLELPDSLSEVTDFVTGARR